MEFIDAWKLDLDELALRGSDAESRQQMDYIFSNAEEGEDAHISLASSAQAEELWRVFHYRFELSPAGVCI